MSKLQHIQTMSYQATKTWRRHTCVLQEREAKVKRYVQYLPNYMIYWKIINYGDSKKDQWFLRAEVGGEMNCRIQDF